MPEELCLRLEKNDSNGSRLSKEESRQQHQYSWCNVVGTKRVKRRGAKTKVERTGETRMRMVGTRLALVPRHQRLAEKQPCIINAKYGPGRRGRLRGMSATTP